MLQAIGLASGGEVFVLDMGYPVRIADLARQMADDPALRMYRAGAQKSGRRR